jgi:acetoin utilization deacetylase AcuC-like enzyme
MTARLVVVGPVGADAHNGGSHPERPARIDAVMAGVAVVAAELAGDLLLVEAEPAPEAALLRVHSASWLAEFEATCRAGGGQFDPDTYATSDTWLTARRAAGAGLQAIEIVRAESPVAAFVATRPPGHHAVADRAMGFCLLNNVAVSAAALVAQGERVVIVDWDVHHGNGTQDLFWNDPNVLYVSTHQWPCYPGTGAADEVGGPGARGMTVNVPLPAGATGDVVARALDEIAGPVVAEFAPTWVLISAGYDAHRNDPLAELALSSADYGILTALVGSWAPGPGRTVVFLEGGYDLKRPTTGGPGTESIRRAGEIRQRAVS